MISCTYNDLLMDIRSVMGSTKRYVFTRKPEDAIKIVLEDSMLLRILQIVKGNKHNYGSLMTFIVTVTSCSSTDK